MISHAGLTSENIDSVGLELLPRLALGLCHVDCTVALVFCSSKPSSYC